MPTTDKKDRTVNIVVAEDHVLLRELIVSLLRRNSAAFNVVAEADDLEGALRVCNSLRPDLLLIRVALLIRKRMSTSMNIGREIPDVNVLAYAGPHASEKDILQAIRLGITGCIDKGSTGTELLAAIERTRNGSTYFCAATGKLLSEVASGRRPEPTRTNGLSPREIEVLRLVAQGNTNKQIATLLGLSLATVDTHRRNLMVKVNAHNAADLIRFGHQFQLLENNSPDAGERNGPLN